MDGSISISLPKKNFASFISGIRKAYSIYQTDDYIQLNTPNSHEKKNEIII